MALRPFGKKKTFIDHAADFAEQALDTLEDAFDQARETAKEVSTQAREQAGPALADARERAKPLLEEGRALAAEKAAVGAAAAKTAVAAGAALAAERAATGREAAGAKLAELTDSEPEPKGGRWKKFALVAGLLALGGFLFRKLRSSEAEDNWESSYVPPPAPAPGPPPSPTDTLENPLTDPLPGDQGAQEGDDPGGAGPDEALADAAEGPHEVTTPDDPAESVEVEEQSKS